MLEVIDPRILFYKGSIRSYHLPIRCEECPFLPLLTSLAPTGIGGDGREPRPYGNRAPTETEFSQQGWRAYAQVHCIWSIKQVQLSMASWYFYRPLAVTIVCLFM